MSRSYRAPAGHGPHTSAKDAKRRANRRFRRAVKSAVRSVDESERFPMILEFTTLLLR